ncbi:RND family efflux transporter MFP subunit [Celeribacter persicus]|uniref:RND family efflux transporter MFP subunit n=2 Tax=Celeribacter persicus TaxID=1651082 RepID=A0A2T5H4B6_9RHOB|nr:RND family efflux transporter MFP subunit [Celeribacter persicus]
MRAFLTAVASLVIVGGAYSLTFGVPAQLKSLLGMENAQNLSGVPSGSFMRVGKGEATVVVTEPLSLRPYNDVIRAVGSGRAIHRANVTTEGSGEVIATYVAANRLVEAGDLLVELDARSQQLALELAEANLKQAEQTVERYTQLRANGNLTLSAVTLSEAQTALEQNRIAVEMAKITLDAQTVRAPISGRLGLSEVETGDILSVNDPIVSIDDLSALLVQFEVPERAIGLLQKETTILASTPSFVGKVFEGEIESFDSRLDSVTRSLTVRARVENPEGLLWSGMTFSVQLIHESEPLPAVPATAITWSRDGSKIWIVEEGKAVSIPVVILHRQDETVWLDTDIAPGVQVVTEGAQKLHEGGAVASRNLQDSSGSAGFSKAKDEVPS